MGQDSNETKTKRKRGGRSKEKKSAEKVVTNEEQKQQGNGSNPSNNKKKKSQEFCPFGNYKNYYGYRVSLYLHSFCDVKSVFFCLIILDFLVIIVIDKQ